MMKPEMNNKEMKKEPYFSVIIPAYNAERHIKKSVKSILTNDYLDFEIIIVDDGSSDNTKSVCKSLVDEDERIVYIYQENSGPNVARNNAIKHAKGKYILFLDADDELTKNSMKIISNELKSESYDFVNFGISFINEKTNNVTKKITYDRMILKNDEILNASMEGIGVLSVCWSKAISREFLLKNNIEFIPDKVHGRDIIFSRYLSLKAKKSLVISNILVHSFEVDDSFSRTFSIKNIKSAIQVSDDLNKIFKNENIDKDILNYAIYKHLRYISILASFRLEEFISYSSAIKLVKESFPSLTYFKNCKKLKDYLFVIWLKFPRASFYISSLLKKINIRPY
jgi:glycosyltransferase involved in cell wall biosynthesis